uniref:Uncharacterized protein n=1 Tax=Arundo donax TaxID=35708 RepID=A0A0A9GS04_ARUDO
MHRASPHSSKILTYVLIVIILIQNTTYMISVSMTRHSFEQAV